MKPLNSQSDSPFEDVVNALKQGDTETLFRFLDKTVDINIAGRSTKYSKAQAEILLNDFFSKNKVESFVLQHQGQAGGSRYGSGIMVTSGGSFRTHFFLQKNGDSQVLNELRFESE